MGCEIDEQLGKRLRRRRKLLELTQQDLAAAVGLSCQQIQKYECGADRISAARLWRLAEALDAPVGYFFDGLGESRTVAATPALHLDEPNGGVEVRDLVGIYHRVSDRKRRQIFAMVRSLTHGGALAAV